MRAAHLLAVQNGLGLTPAISSLSTWIQVVGNQTETRLDKNVQLVIQVKEMISILCCSIHRDHSIHIERTCQLHDMKMTRHGLLHRGLTSADQAECLNNKKIRAVIKKQPNLGYDDVKLDF